MGERGGGLAIALGRRPRHPVARGSGACTLLAYTTFADTGPDGVWGYVDYEGSIMDNRNVLLARDSFGDVAYLYLRHPIERGEIVRFRSH